MNDWTMELVAELPELTDYSMIPPNQGVLTFLADAE